MTAPSVTILLSTYNGENYLKTQLDSICEQSHCEWSVAWRDDGSADNSIAIVEAFAKNAGPERFLKSPSSGFHIGATPSFLQLLSENCDAPLVAFADQDDRWLPLKLQRAIDRLADAGDLPALYCSRQLLTDDDFSHPVFSMQYLGRPGFPASLTQNIASGNTIVMNQAGARLVASIPAPVAALHDWWSYIVVSACGGLVIYDAEPTIMYRQHMTNLIGSQLPTISRAIAALERGPGIYMTMMRRHTAQLHAFEDRMTPQARRALELIRKGLSGGFSDRLAALRCPDFKRGDALDTLLFRIWFVLH